MRMWCLSVIRLEEMVASCECCSGTKVNVAIDKMLLGLRITYYQSLGSARSALNIFYTLNNTLYVHKNSHTGSKVYLQ